MKGIANRVDTAFQLTVLLSPELCDLLRGMLTEDPLRRWTMAQVSQSEWLTGAHQTFPMIYAADEEMSEPAIALDDPLHPSYQPFLWEEDDSLVDIWDRIATSEDTIADISLVEDVNPGITALLSHWENGTAQGLSSENGVEQPEGGVLLNEKDDVELMSMMDDPTPPGTPATSTAFPPSPVKRQRNSDADEPEEKRRKFGPEETPPRLEIGPEEYMYM
jgi:serine/threonine protein kinase